MLKRCIATRCSTSSGEGYSLHAFPRDESIRKKWITAVKWQRSNWSGPTAYSVLCSKHFEADCYALEGSCYRDTVGIPAKKRLKPDTVPTIFPNIFPKSIHGGSSGTSAPSKRPTSERRQRKSVSKLMQDAYTHSYHKNNSYINIAIATAYIAIMHACTINYIGSG